MPNGKRHSTKVVQSRMVVCEEHWRLMCSLSWQYGTPALSNEKGWKSLPIWLQRKNPPFASDKDCTRMEGYDWDNHYLYKFVWRPGDVVDHLDVYRSRRIDVLRWSRRHGVSGDLVRIW